MNAQEVIDIDLPKIQTAVITTTPIMEKYPPLRKLLKLACNIMGQNMINIKTKSAKRIYAETRMLYYWMAYHYTNHTYKRIAQEVNRDHATAYWGLHVMDNLMFMPREKMRIENYLSVIRKALKGYETVR